MRRAAFIDRDGTINVNRDHLNKVEDLELIPGAGEAIARLNTAGYAVLVITNQSAIARGLLTEDGLAEIHEALGRQLAVLGATIDGFYYCPHHPEHGTAPYCMVCECRKPAPGMILQAGSEHHIDLACSVMVGDNMTDVQAGWNAGCQSALVRTGYGEKMLDKMDEQTRDRISYVGRDLADVVDWILRGT